MPEKQKRGSGGQRKVGRNMAKCKRYRDEHRREKNKKRRMDRLERKYAKNREKRKINEKI